MLASPYLISVCGFVCLRVSGVLYTNQYASRTSARFLTNDVKSVALVW